MWRIPSLLHPIVSHILLFLIIARGGRWLNPTLLSYEDFKLLHLTLLKLNNLLSLSVDAVIGVQLLLQLDDSLISLVKPRRQCNHDIPLF